MKRALICLLMLGVITACYDSDTMGLEASAEQPSQMESAIVPAEETVKEEIASGYEKLPLEAYIEFSELLEGEQPSFAEMADFLALQIQAYEYSITEDRELWSFERTDSARAIDKTQLVACAIPKADNQVTYYGVDRTNGHLFRWDEGNIQNAERIDNVVQFSSPQVVLNYVIDRFWNSDQFAVEYELELVGGDDTMPAYSSQWMEWNGKRFQLIVDIDVKDEEQYLVHCYENVREDEEWGHTATTNWYNVYKNGFISDFWGNRYLAMPNDPVSKREFSGTP